MIVITVEERPESGSALADNVGSVEHYCQVFRTLDLPALIGFLKGLKKHEGLDPTPTRMLSGLDGE